MVNMKRFLKIAMPIAVALLFFYGISSPYVNKVSKVRKTVIVEINDQTIVADTAITRNEKEKGLSGRDSLWINGGMLFVFDIEDKQHFWMKDMNFPIDIVWISGNEVVGIERDVQPEPDVSREELSIYSSPEPVDKVLEIQAGRSDSLNLEEGDQVEFNALASDELDDRLSSR